MSGRMILAAIAAVALSAFGAEAVNIQVKNCTSEMIGVIAYHAEGPASGIAAGPETQITPSSTAAMSCNGNGCKIEVKYHHGSNPGWDGMTYHGDVCTKSLTATYLEPIGNCSC